jgi:phenylacetate-CoA ligase
MFSLQRLKQIYDLTPMWLKRFSSNMPARLLYGSCYAEQLKFLVQSANWNKAELSDYQTKKLFALVEFAATTVPYYRDLFRRLRLPIQMRTLEEFSALPLLTKDIVREQSDRMISEAIPARKRYMAKTGGTTFSPLSFWMSSEAYGREWAFVHDLLSRYGISRKDRKIVIRGTEFKGISKGLYFQCNPVYAELQISPFHLNHTLIQELLPTIKKFSPSYIYGYPSAISAFAKIAREDGLGPGFAFKGVFTISESLYDHQKRLIEDAFGCPVFSFYGQSERVIFAGYYPGREGYYIDPRYGLTEVIEDELVGTGFLNLATPLLRYRTGDSGVIDYPNGEVKGIDAFPHIKKLEGRWLQDAIVNKGGQEVSVMVFPYDLFDGIEKFQFVQQEIGKVEVCVVPSASFDKELTIKKIIKIIKERVGNEFDFEVKVVSNLVLTSRGKQPLVIQQIASRTTGSRRKHERDMAP